MPDGTEKLAQDVAILSAMAGNMAAYLDSDVLFWPLSYANMPMLTLGGYLMREHRLLALRDQLTAEQQAEVDTAMAQFNEALAERIVRFEGKAHNELDARLRQWEAYLKDIARGTFDTTSNYDTAVETRAMIAALIDRLQMPPYQLAERPQQHLAVLDSQLRNHWRTGDFVWPQAWTPAYPTPAYWWLYGGVREPEVAS